MVGQFEGTIQQIVALAVLMPIVAGMGGNAGTQVLALMVRGLALGQVELLELPRAAVEGSARSRCSTGLGLGLILATVVQLRFGNWGLTAVIAAALLINQLAAAIAGVLIPLSLRRLGFDPALASSIFLTTVTDVMGFFAFLGLATLFLLN